MWQRLTINEEHYDSVNSLQYEGNLSDDFVAGMLAAYFASLQDKGLFQDFIVQKKKRKFVGYTSSDYFDFMEDYLSERTYFHGFGLVVGEQLYFFASMDFVTGLTTAMDLREDDIRGYLGSGLITFAGDEQEEQPFPFYDFADDDVNEDDVNDNGFMTPGVSESREVNYSQSNYFDYY